MAQKDQARPQVGETERSFKSDDNDGRQPDLFSRNDREGVPAKQSSKPDKVAEDPGVLEAGAAGGYQTDTFSRGDEAGVPQDDLGNAEAAAKDVSRVEDAPDVRKKARDDPDSRDAPPMTGPEGGVR